MELFQLTTESAVCQSSHDSIETHWLFQKPIGISETSLWQALKTPNTPLPYEQKAFGDRLCLDHRRVRELAFEYIRATEFPKKPSRQKCLYFMERHAIEYWKKYLCKSNPSLELFKFEVDSNGLFHFGTDRSFCLLETRSIADWLKRARAYWGDEVRDSNRSEVLFEGRVLSCQRVDDA